MRLARDQSEDQEQGQKRFRLLSVPEEAAVRAWGGRGRVSVNAMCVPVHTLFLSSRGLTIPVFAQKHLFS